MLTRSNSRSQRYNNTLTTTKSIQIDFNHKLIQKQNYSKTAPNISHKYIGSS